VLTLQRRKTSSRAAALSAPALRARQQTLQLTQSIEAKAKA
jgi:hypothetical protein